MNVAIFTVLVKKFNSVSQVFIQDSLVHISVHLSFPGSSDEGESTSGATGGGGGSENAEMEESGSTRTSSNSSSNNPVYRDLKLLQTGGEVPPEYNPQEYKRTAYQQRGYSPGMDRSRNYEKEQLQPSPSSREEERKSSWDYEKNTRKEYSRSRDYNEYRESYNSERSLQTHHERSYDTCFSIVGYKMENI